MEELVGGRPGLIFASAGKVVRPAGQWTPTIHRFLTYISERGMTGVPTPFGTNDLGQEIVSFVDGRVARSLSDEEVRSESVLTSAAALLRKLHRASAGFLEHDSSPKHWMLPPKAPYELVCHGDFAPYNVTIDGQYAVGLIDFDTAHPAPRMWDLAYAVYRWAPLSDPDSSDIPFDVKQQAHRAGLFCGAYGIDTDEASLLIEAICERLTSLCQFIETRALEGDTVFQANINDGHVKLYRNDITYIRMHGDVFASSMRHVARDYVQP